MTGGPLSTEHSSCQSYNMKMMIAYPFTLQFNFNFSKIDHRLIGFIIDPSYLFKKCTGKLKITVASNTRSEVNT